MKSDVRKPTDAPRVPTRRAPKLRKVDASSLPMSCLMFDKAEASSTDQIVTSVIQAIVAHRLTPGTKLVEQRIGDLFGVSRTIVRQALQRLSELKLVRLEPARGAFVAAPSPEEARQVFAVRRMVETQMLHELVRQLKPAHIKALKAHLQAEQQALTQHDVAQRTKLLFDFHVKLAELLGNQVLVSLIQELVSRCSLISLMYQTDDDADTSHAEHIDILLALERKDSDLAVKLLHEHLSSVERQLLKQPLTSSPNAIQS